MLYSQLLKMAGGDDNLSPEEKFKKNLMGEKTPSPLYTPQF